MTRLSARLLLCVPFIAFGRAGVAAEPKQPLEVPCEIVGRVLFVKGRLNGRGPFTFIVDTGASETVVTPRAARRAGVAGVDLKREQQSAWAESIELGAVSAGRLPIFVYDPPQALPLRLDKGMDYHGLLGYTFLSQCVLRIDYRGRTVAFIPPERYKPGELLRGRATHMVPFQVRDRLVRARGSVNGRGPVVFLVDTGSAEVLLLPAAAEKLGLTGRALRRRGEVGFAELKALALGKAVVEGVPAVIHTLPQDRGRRPGYDGILGTPFLGNFVVTIDYRARRMYLQPYGKATP